VSAGRALRASRRSSPALGLRRHVVGDSQRVRACAQVALRQAAAQQIWLSLEIEQLPASSVGLHQRLVAVAAGALPEPVVEHGRLARFEQLHEPAVELCSGLGVVARVVAGGIVDVVATVAGVYQLVDRQPHAGRAFEALGVHRLARPCKPAEHVDDRREPRLPRFVGSPPPRLSPWPGRAVDDGDHHRVDHGPLLDGQFRPRRSGRSQAGESGDGAGDARRSARARASAAPGGRPVRGSAAKKTRGGDERRSPIAGAPRPPRRRQPPAVD
jgi:hypothetical protein